MSAATTPQVRSGRNSPEDVAGGAATVAAGGGVHAQAAARSASAERRRKTVGDRAEPEAVAAVKAAVAGRRSGADKGSADRPYVLTAVGHSLGGAELLIYLVMQVIPSCKHSFGVHFASCAYNAIFHLHMLAMAPAMYVECCRPLLLYTTMVTLLRVCSCAGSMCTTWTAWCCCHPQALCAKCRSWWRLSHIACPRWSGSRAPSQSMACACRS